MLDPWEEAVLEAGRMTVMKRRARGRVSGGGPSVTLTGLSTDSLGEYGQIGDHASIGYTIDPDNGTETVKWSNSSDPSDSATYGTGANPTDFTASDGDPVYLHVTDDGKTVTTSFTARKEPATGGTDLDLSFTEDSAITATDLVANWTANSNTLTFVSVSPTLPAGLSIDSAGEMTGTPTDVTADATYTLTMEDEYGREVSDTFTLEITAASAAFTDDFTGTNGALLSARSGWTLVYDQLGTGAREFTIQSNQLRAFVLNPASAANIVYDYDQTLNDNQYCQIEVANVGLGANRTVRLYIRRTSATADGDGYFVDFDLAGGSMNLRRVTGGSLTTLGTHSNSFSAGHKVRIEANGTTIRALLDTGGGFTEVISATDATYSSGKASLGNRLATSGLNTELTLDNWEAGNL